MSEQDVKVVLVAGRIEHSAELEETFFKHFKFHESSGIPLVNQKVIHDNLGSFSDPQKYFEVIVARLNINNVQNDNNVHGQNQKKNNVQEKNQNNVQGHHGQIVGTCMYQKMFSFYRGRIIQMEQFYVEPEFRGFKIGFKMMKQLAEIALKQNAILEWCCREWNQLGMNFYRSFGGQEVSQTLNLENNTKYIGFRMTREQLENVTSNSDGEEKERRREKEKK